MTSRRIVLDLDPPLLNRMIAEQLALLPGLEIVTETAKEAEYECLISTRGRGDEPSVLTVGRGGPLSLPLRLGAVTDHVRYLLSLRSRYARREGGRLSLGPFDLLCGESLLRHRESGVEIRLTDKERLFLEALHDAGVEGIDRKALLTLVWGYAETAETHTLETHLYRLRQKLEPLGGGQLILSTDGTYRLGEGFVES